MKEYFNDITLTVELSIQRHLIFCTYHLVGFLCFALPLPCNIPSDDLLCLPMYSVANNARLRSVSDKFDVGYHGNGAGAGLIHGDQEVRPLFVAVGLM
jgi:hypothetical protein